MLNPALSMLCVTVAAVLAAPMIVQAQEQKPAKAAASEAPAKLVKSGHVEAGGISYYYEIRGEGEPLLLLHGGLGSIDMFAPVMPILTEKRQIIGVDLQGHGRTPLGNRPISLEAMGADMAEILGKLGYDKVDALGYSMGAGVAFQLAVQHPEKLRRLVLVSAGYAQDGFYPEMIALQAQLGAKMADFMKETPMYKSYVAIAPKPEDFPRLLDAMGEFIRRPYDWSAEVAKLTMPVMLVYGDSDMFRPEHIVKFYQLLGGGLRDAGWQRENMAKNRLAILPGHTHYDIFLAPELARTALTFLDGKGGAANWGDEVRN
jgi:pimeloyl-ACP methyl ester carboxylesterase